MKLSAALVALIPPDVVTVTSTVPELCAGDVAVIELALSVLMVAVTPPKLTAVAPFKFVPPIVTVAPPAILPTAGDTEVTVGTAMYVYWSAALVGLVPSVVVTVTSTVPLPAGAVAVI